MVVTSSIKLLINVFVSLKSKRRQHFSIGSGHYLENVSRRKVEIRLEKAQSYAVLCSWMKPIKRNELLKPET